MSAFDKIKHFLKHSNEATGPTPVGSADVDSPESTKEKLLEQLTDIESLPNSLQTDKLNMFIENLCSSVVTSGQVETVWNVMRALLCSHLGYTVIRSMCMFLQDRIYHSKVAVLRGAVHFISLTLWGDTSRKITSLKYKADAVLPSFVHACDCRQPSVGIEIADAVTLLVKCQGRDLPTYTWNVIIDVCDMLVTNFGMCNTYKQHVEQNNGEIVINPCEFTEKVHNLLTAIEVIENENQYYLGSTDRFYDILEKCSLTRPVDSIYHLIEKRRELVDPHNANWIESMNRLMQTFYQDDRRTEVKLRALFVLASVLDTYRHTLEEQELVDTVVVTYLADVDKESDINIRTQAVNIIISILKNCRLSLKCSDMLDIVKSVLYRPLLNNEIANMHSSEMMDVDAAVSGLIEVFEKQLHTTQCVISADCFKILIQYLDRLYPVKSEMPPNQELLLPIKERIFDFVLRIRASGLGQIALLSREHRREALTFSPFVLCSISSEVPSPATNATNSITTNGTLSPTAAAPSLNQNSSNATVTLNHSVVNLTEMFDVIISSLKHEKSWPVIRLVLVGLKDLLSNKAIVYKSNSRAFVNELAYICSAMIVDKNKKYPDSLSDTPKDFKKTDFHCHVYPVLEALLIYGKDIDYKNQNSLLKSIQTGLMNQKSRHQCILALSIAIFESQDAMAKLLPELLLSLSKISATSKLAIPKLEFLSNLILFPRLYANFTPDQYMSIFAIVLPYTNSFTYNDYTIALAHRVIAMWFLKCRQIWRKQFVTFIRKNLETNIKPEEETFRARLASEIKRSPGSPESFRPHSANHPTSPSHHTTGYPISPSPITPTLSNVFSFNSPPPSAGSEMDAPNFRLAADAESKNSIEKQRHAKELFESCMDLLSRYAFGQCSSVPNAKRPLADFLLDKSQSCSWLLGHKLITITTTGCTARSFLKGLCEQCYRICKSVDGSLRNHERSDSESEQMHSMDDVEDSSVFQAQRRRHASAFNSRPSDIRQNRFYDDTHLDAQPSAAQSSGNTCGCWCQGWAEITVRRPTGNTAWMMRIENSLSMATASGCVESNYSDLCNYYTSQTHSNQSAEHSNQTDTDQVDGAKLVTMLKEPAAAIDIKGPRKENDPNQTFRRASSSPEIEQPISTLGTSPVEVAGDLTEATVIAVSPPENKGNLHRSMSLGKNDPSHRPLNRAASLSSNARKNSPTTQRTLSHDPDIQNQNHGDWKDTANYSVVKRDLSLNFGEQPRAQQKPSAPNSPTKSAKVSPKPPRTPLDDIYEQPSMRDRSSTISVMTPARDGRRDARLVGYNQVASSSQENFTKATGLHPSFVFLQLFYDPSFSKNKAERPLMLPKSDVIERAIKNLDYITPYETHKVGILFVGPGQAEDKVAILANEYGSSRFMDMLRSIGNLIRLEKVEAQTCYIGGLAQDGQDGKFTYCWQDNLTQVVFHVAPLMPYKERDPNCNDKMRHIGNDFICIVYNDSNSPFNRAVLKAQQVQIACIVITPLDHAANLVEIQCEDSLIKVIGHKPDPFMISDCNLALYVRQIAIHLNLAGHIVHKQRGSEMAAPYVSNWVERLKQLKRIEQKTLESHNGQSHSVFGSHEQMNSFQPQINAGMRPRSNTMQVTMSSSDDSFEILEKDLPDDFTKYS